MTTRVSANGIDLAYDVQGSGDPLLLVMGLGGQLTDWHPGLVGLLAEHFTVIRFDNRDIGLSSYDTSPAPSRWELIKANLRPGSRPPPYTLADMADDTAALLDALDIEQAHVVGMSMGAMISQLLTIRHEAKVSSLCSIMSNTGDRRHGRPSARVVASMARRGQPDRASAVDVTVSFLGLIGGADWDEAEQRSRTTASLARAYNPAGVLRQSLAIAAAADRTPELEKIARPSLIMHGLDDTLVRPSGGIATARAIPDSRLIMYPRMGHDLPSSRHQEMVQAIRTNALRARPAVLPVG